MDTSKEYIKMCGKAKGIQNEYKPKTGDFQANKILFTTGVYSGKYPFNKKKIWLPRQDQSQEMIEGIWQNVFVRFLYFYEDVDIVKFGSMEQLWLVFVMKEKHHKVWDGKEWINENSGD